MSDQYGFLCVDCATTLYNANSYFKEKLRNVVEKRIIVDATERGSI